MLHEAVGYSFRQNVTTQNCIVDLPESGTAESTRLIALILSIKNPKEERSEKGGHKPIDYKRLVLLR